MNVPIRFSTKKSSKYHIFSRSNSFKQKYKKNNGGGVAIFYKKELKVRKLTNIIEPEEVLWVEVKSKPSFILGIVYRSEYT